MFECDYDANPTVLYQAIEARQWDVAERLFHDDDDDGENGGKAGDGGPGAAGGGGAGGGGGGGATTSTGSSSATLTRPLAPTEQAATWVTRKEPDGKLRWRLLPIHASVIFRAPLRLVRTLLAVHPRGAKCKDDQGMLPLHLAFRNDASDAIVQELLSSHPGGIDVRDRKGRTPLECATGSSSPNPMRGSLIGTYATIAVAAERRNSVRRSVDEAEGRIARLETDHAQRTREMKASHVTRIAELEGRVRRTEEEREAAERTCKGLRVELVEKGASERGLASKMRELASELDRVTRELDRARSSSTHAGGDASASSASVAAERDSLRDKVEGMRRSQTSALTDVAKLKLERTTILAENEALKRSYEETRTVNEVLSEENRALENRVDGLVVALRGMLDKHAQLRSTVEKQGDDMKSAMAVRERMMAAVDKQEADMHRAAAARREALDEILDRQAGDAEEVLSRILEEGSPKKRAVVIVEERVREREREMAMSAAAEGADDDGADGGDNGG